MDDRRPSIDEREADANETPTGTDTHAVRTVRLGLLVAFCLFVFGGVATAGQAATSAPAVFADGHVQDCAATPPADHEDPQGDTDDVTGWVEGYWYDERLDIDDSNGLNQTQLARLTARTAARVEALRCHRFDELPPLQTLSREQYRDRLEQNVNDSYDADSRQFENATLAATLLVGQNEDAVDVTVENQAAFPAAFYDTREEFMAFVTDTPDRVEIDEPTLAHELVHALQDDQFEVGSVFDATTSDNRTASLAVVEGDATLVADQYRDNCGVSVVPGVPGGERRWAEECLSLTPEPSDPPNWGLTLTQLAAYHTPLVEDTYDREGWDGVDALFDSLPESMVEALDPGKYGEFERADLAVPDRSTDDWERVTPAATDQTESVPGYEVVGQHGLTAMLVAPSFESPGARVVDVREFQLAPGVFNYDHSVTDGWQNDRLYGYANGEGETAAVWTLQWNDAQNASEFASAYEDLVEFRDGDPIEEGADVFTFEDSAAFEMALSVDRTGDRVQIVTAPTVETLDTVHDVDIGTDELDRSATETDSESNQTDGKESGVDGDGAGFGVVVAVVALVGLVTAVRHGRRRQ